MYIYIDDVNKEYEYTKKGFNINAKLGLVRPHYHLTSEID